MNKTKPESTHVDGEKIPDVIRRLESLIAGYQRTPNDLSLFEGSKAYRKGYLHGVSEVLNMLKEL